MEPTVRRSRRTRRATKSGRRGGSTSPLPSVVSSPLCSLCCARSRYSNSAASSARTDRRQRSFVLGRPLAFAPPPPPMAESERSRQRVQMSRASLAQQHQRPIAPQRRTHRRQACLRSQLARQQRHHSHERRADPAPTAPQPAHDSGQFDLRPQITSGPLHAQPLRKLARRLDLVQAAAQAAGQTVGQQTEGLLRKWAVPARHPHPRRHHPRVAAVPRQAAAALGMPRTRLEPCLTPGSFANVLLAGQRRVVTQLHRPGPARSERGGPPDFRGSRNGRSSRCSLYSARLTSSGGAPSARTMTRSTRAHFIALPDSAPVSPSPPSHQSGKKTSRITTECESQQRWSRKPGTSSGQERSGSRALTAWQAPLTFRDW